MKKILLFVVAAMVAAMGYAQSNSPLCFTARNGSVEVKFKILNITHTIQYSTDSVNWNTYNSNSTVTINADQSIWFRAATNQTTATPFAYVDGEFLYYSQFAFVSTTTGAVVEGSGNIMSLYGPDCPDLPLQERAFLKLFCGCRQLTTAPELPATTLAYRCYYMMFDGCNSLVTPPALLPAMTLAEECYNQMFADCNSLATAPDMPATTMAEGCCFCMFQNCGSLVTPPALPAMALAEDCYAQMFDGCTSLTTAPDLPATTLASGCYSSMFYGCSSLTTLPALPADSLTPYCYSYMFADCTSLVVNTAAPGKPWMIPATTTADYALYLMFNCTGGTMKSTPELNTTYYIASDTTVTPVSEVESSRYVAYSNDGRIFVNGAMGKNVKVYDVNGRLVAETPNANEMHEFAVGMTGIYMVCIDNRNAVKVIVK